MVLGRRSPSFNTNIGIDMSIVVQLPRRTGFAKAKRHFR